MDGRAVLENTDPLSSLLMDLRTLIFRDYLERTGRLALGLTARRHYQFFKDNFSSATQAKVYELLTKRGLLPVPEIFKLSELNDAEAICLLWINLFPCSLITERNALAMIFGSGEGGKGIETSTNLTFWRVLLFRYFAMNNIDITLPTDYRTLVTTSNLDYFKQLFTRHAKRLNSSTQSLFTADELKEITKMLGPSCEELTTVSPPISKRQLLLDLGYCPGEEESIYGQANERYHPNVVRTLETLYQTNLRAAKWVSSVLSTLAASDYELIRTRLSYDAKNTEELLKNIFVLDNFTLKSSEETGSENDVSASQLHTIKSVMINDSENYKALSQIEDMIKRLHEKNFLFLVKQLPHGHETQALLRLLLSLLNNYYWTTFKFNRLTPDELITFKEVALLEHQAKEKAKKLPANLVGCISNEFLLGNYTGEFEERSKLLALKILPPDSTIWTLSSSMRSALIHSAVSLQGEFGNIDPYLLWQVTQKSEAFERIQILGEQLEMSLNQLPSQLDSVRIGSMLSLLLRLPRVIFDEIVITCKTADSKKSFQSSAEILKLFDTASNFSLFYFLFSIYPFDHADYLLQQIFTTCSSEKITLLSQVKLNHYDAYAYSVFTMERGNFLKMTKRPLEDPLKLPPGATLLLILFDLLAYYYTSMNGTKDAVKKTLALADLIVTWADQPALIDFIDQKKNIKELFTSSDQLGELVHTFDCRDSTLRSCK